MLHLWETIKNIMCNVSINTSLYFIFDMNRDHHVTHWRFRKSHRVHLLMSLIELQTLFWAIIKFSFDFQVAQPQEQNAWTFLSHFNFFQLFVYFFDFNFFSCLRLFVKLNHCVFILLWIKLMRNHIKSLLVYANKLNSFWYCHPNCYWNFIKNIIWSSIFVCAFKQKTSSM